MKEKNENKDICAKCGGYCCKKSGCDYAPEDFSDLSLNYLMPKLSEGYISIVSALDLKSFPNGQIVNIPILYLRARNRNRPIIDLLSMKTTCLSLKEDGCSFSYEDRPFGGRSLTPVVNRMCYSKVNPEEIILRWQNHQQVLARAVKRITGKSVNEVLKKDVENLFFDVFMQHYDGVSEREVKEILELIPDLQQAYPLEYKIAKSRYKTIENPNILKRLFK